jgi:hypothetical protein
MGIDDKANYTVIHHIDTATSGPGRLTGSDDLEREGQGRQSRDKFQAAGERVRETVRELKEGSSKD